jgi:hypothetical protein
MYYQLSDYEESDSDSEYENFLKNQKLKMRLLFIGKAVTALSIP